MTTYSPHVSPAQLNALERRLFFIPSFKIYGSVAGFYDYGPPGCAIKQHVTQTWRTHFILEENMLEVGWLQLPSPDTGHTAAGCQQARRQALFSPSANAR